MTYKEARKMIPHVRAKFGTANFTRTSYTAQEWFDCISEALEKQIPMKPSIEIYENRVKREQKVKVCPRCKEVEFGYDEIPYCDNCGQRIDWSDVEE